MNAAESFTQEQAQRMYAALLLIATIPPDNGYVSEFMARHANATLTLNKAKPTTDPLPPVVFPYEDYDEPIPDPISINPLNMANMTNKLGSIS